MTNAFRSENKTKRKHKYEAYICLQNERERKKVEEREFNAMIASTERSETHTATQF